MILSSSELLLLLEECFELTCCECLDDALDEASDFAASNIELSLELPSDSCLLFADIALKLDLDDASDFLDIELALELPDFELALELAELNLELFLELEALVSTLSASESLELEELY